MDFLPVNSSQNQRLQYTESYVLPHDMHISQGPFHFGGERHINGHAPSQHNHTGMMQESKLQQISGKQEPSVVKAHQEIDDYIKRRSHITNDEHFNEVVNSSNHAKQLNNHLIHESKPFVLESIVKNINLNESDSSRKALPQMVATNDNMELPVIKQSDFDRFDSSNNLEPLREVYESRRHSTVAPLHRRLQQSSVNINLESQVRNQVPRGQQPQSSLALEGITQSMNNDIKGRQLPRNLQRYVVRPIAQLKELNIGEPKPKENYQNRQQIINIPQIQSQSGYRAAPRQSVRRNLIQIVPQNSINRSSAIQQSHPIEISHQQSESFNGRDSFSLKRNLQQSQKLSNSSQQIVIDPQYSGQFRVRSNGIPLQRSFLVEKPQGPKSIIIEPENYKLNNSQLIKQQRQLQQRRFLDQSIPIELQQFLNEDLTNPYLKSSLKRKIQYPIQPPPVQVQIQQQDQNYLNESLRNSLRRQLEAQKAEAPINIEIEPKDHYINRTILKSSIRRQLEAAASQPPINVDILPENQSFMAQSMKSSIRRTLLAQAPPPALNVQIPYEEEHQINQSFKSSVKRRLESQAPPPPLYLEIPLQDYHILQQSLKESIRRKLGHQQPSQPVSIQIPNQKEQVIQESLKNSLRRKLESQAPPPPVYVQIPLQDQHILYESLKSSLKRKLQPQAQPQPVSVDIPVLNEHILQQSLKSSLRRKLQSPAPPPPIYVQIPFEDYNFLQESQRKSLRRKLQSKVSSQPVSVQVPFQNEQVLQENLKNSIRRRLQSQPQPLPIYIQIPDQDYHVLKESQKNSLRRKVNAQAPPPPVNISIGQDNEFYIAMDGSKSSLRRNLQAVQQPDPIFVQLHQHQYSLYQSQRSTLKRKIVPQSHEEAITVDLGPLKEHRLHESLKGTLKRKLEPLSYEKSHKNEVQPSIQVELNDTHQQSLQENLKSSLRRKLDNPVSHRYIDIQEPIIHNEILQDVKDPLNDSFHLSDLSERMETIDTPRNITMLKRDLQLNQSIPRPVPQLPVNLKEVSQQVIDTSSYMIVEEPVQMKRSVHLNYDPCEQDIKSKALLLSKRHLKAEPLIDNSQRSCEEGWNPTKNIFNLFRIPATTNNASQISFKKHRINTSSLLH